MNDLEEHPDQAENAASQTRRQNEKA
jgi:hypothetical protein